LVYAIPSFEKKYVLLGIALLAVGFGYEMFAKAKEPRAAALQLEDSLGFKPGDRYCHSLGAQNRGVRRNKELMRAGCGQPLGSARRPLARPG
jgi:hypothetical protein